MSNVINLSNPTFCTTIVDFFRIATFKNASPLQQKITLAALAILTLAALVIATSLIGKSSRQSSLSRSNSNDPVLTPSIDSSAISPASNSSTSLRASSVIPSAPSSSLSTLACASSSTGPVPSTSLLMPPSPSPVTPPASKIDLSTTTSSSTSATSSSDTIWIGISPSEVQTAATPIAITANRLFVQHSDIDRVQDIYFKPSEFGPVIIKIAHCSIRHFLTEAPVNTMTKRSFMFVVNIYVPGEQDPTPARLCLVKKDLALYLLDSRLNSIWNSGLQLFDSDHSNNNHQVLKSFEKIQEHLMSKQPK